MATSKIEEKVRTNVEKILQSMEDYSEDFTISATQRLQRIEQLRSQFNQILEALPNGNCCLLLFWLNFNRVLFE